MFTESIAQRDQSRSPREPSSSRISRCSFAQTRAADHSVKRRCAVGPDGPKTGGNCRQVQPVVATKMIAASTSRSPYRRRPPPCGRDGVGGITRWNRSYNSSGTKRSTISTSQGYRQDQMRRRLRQAVKGVDTASVLHLRTLSVAAWLHVFGGRASSRKRWKPGNQPQETCGAKRLVACPGAEFLAGPPFPTGKDWRCRRRLSHQKRTLLFRVLKPPGNPRRSSITARST